MRIGATGTGILDHLRPFWAEADANAGAPAGESQTGASETGSQAADSGGTTEGQNGSAFDPVKTFAELDTDSRDWLQKTKLDQDPKALAKHAYQQEKLLGNAIRKPGKDATPEEREAFLNKLGRPEKPEGYEFKVPEKLPEGLPYDGERAAQLKTDMHKLGLTQEQAQAIHDLYINEQVEAFTTQSGASAAAMQSKAETATAELTKLWGPLDGDTARANFEIADQVFKQAPGGQELLSELQAIGLVGANKEVLSVPIAKFLASIGSALYTEDSVLRGRPDAVGNPFSESSENVTEQMAMVKNDPDRARSLIAAAGKKPSDFGLT